MCVHPRARQNEPTFVVYMQLNTREIYNIFFLFLKFYNTICIEILHLSCSDVYNEYNASHIYYNSSTNQHTTNLTQKRRIDIFFFACDVLCMCAPFGYIIFFSSLLMLYSSTRRSRCLWIIVRGINCSAASVICISHCE